MSNSLATKRLQREYVSLRRSPIENIVAKPLEENILEWHYVIRGTEEPYVGGYYHGILRFPAEYPLRPPSVLMYTPSGRFKTNRRLCLSMSDFHPESWNPMWSVSTILTGLYSFMIENQPTLGSIEATVAQRRKLAKQSLSYNCNDSTFRILFSDLVQLHDERQRQEEQEAAAEKESEERRLQKLAGSSPSATELLGQNGRTQQLAANGGGLRADRLESNAADNNADGNIFTFIACVGATLAVVILIVFSHFPASTSLAD